MATLDTFQPNLKIEKKTTLKKFLTFFQKTTIIFQEMERSSPKFKKFFSKENFYCISGGNFQSLKNKKNHFEEICYILSYFGMTADQTTK